jgi:hypothetical protein
VSCRSPFIANYSHFDRIKSRTVCGLFEFPDSGDPVTFAASTVCRIVTRQFSMFTKHGGSITILSVNFTNAFAGQRLPGPELGGNAPDVRLCLLQDFTSDTSIGGITLWQCSGFRVTAAFRNLSVRHGGDPAIICWLDGSLQTGVFTGCSVVETPALRGHLFVCQESRKIVFRDCCFAVSKERCCNAVGAFTFESAVFDAAVCRTIDIGTAGESTARPLRAAWAFDGIFMVIAGLSIALVIGQVVAAVGIRTFAI